MCAFLGGSDVSGTGHLYVTDPKRIHTRRTTRVLTRDTGSAGHHLGAHGSKDMQKASGTVLVRRIQWECDLYVCDNSTV